METTTLKPHKLGANRKEPAKLGARKDNNFSQSKDIRESRALRQEKFGQPVRTTMGRMEQPVFQPRNTFPPSKQPEAGPRTVRFTLKHPTAKRICLAGAFNHWKADQIVLERRGETLWEAEVQLRPGVYEYRFVVDGEWVDDPEAKRFAENPYGGRNSVREVV